MAHPPALIRAIIAFITYPDECARANVGVAYHATAIALFAKSPDGHARLLAAEDQIGMVFRHRSLQEFREEIVGPVLNSTH